MKYIAIASILILSALPSCTTTTETRPDGTVVKTWGIDREAFAVGAGAVTTIAVDKTSGK